MFKLIVQRQNEKFNFIILVMAYKELMEAQSELENWSQMIYLVSPIRLFTYYLSTIN